MSAFFASKGVHGRFFALATQRPSNRGRAAPFGQPGKPSSSLCSDRGRLGTGNPDDRRQTTPNGTKRRQLQGGSAAGQRRYALLTSMTGRESAVLVLRPAFTFSWPQDVEDHQSEQWRTSQDREHSTEAKRLIRPDQHSEATATKRDTDEGGKEQESPMGLPVSEANRGSWRTAPQSDPGPDTSRRLCHDIDRLGVRSTLHVASRSAGR